MANLYENMIDAIAAYMKQIETDIEADPKSNEKHEIEHITGDWVASALEADTDAMNAVAEQVKAHVVALRKAESFDLDCQRKVLVKFVRSYFHEFIEEFLVGTTIAFPEDGPAPVTQYPHGNEWDLIGSFACYCHTCGYFEV